MDWEAIKQAAAETNKAAQDQKPERCKCGAKWNRMWTMQAIGFDAQKKCMADLFQFHCENHDPRNPESCQETWSLTVPLKGKTYDDMAEATEKIVNEGK